MIINPYSFATAGGDPYFSNVVLLAHMNGTNGGTTFTDSSASAKTITANGNAKTSTAQSKFNGSSGLFDGTGDYLTIPDSDDWHMAAGDFTFECFIRPANLTGVRTIINQRSTGYCPFAIYSDGTELRVLFSFTNSSWAAVPTIVGGSLAINNWYHVALTRSGSDFKLFVDGVQVGSTYTSAGSFANSANLMYIGGTATSAPFNGYMAEMRLTKGVARYTANFTPPTTAHPDA